MIKIVGLGPGSKDAITFGTLELLKSSSNVILRTEKHPTVKYLKEMGIAFQTYDEKYEKSESFDDVYSSIAEDIIKRYSEAGEVVYAVPGHPLVAEKSVEILLKLCKKQNIEAEVLPAVSFIDVVMERLQIDPVRGLKIIDAFDIKNQILDKRIGLIVTQVYNKFIASDVKLALLEYYKDDTEIYFIRAAGVKDTESIRTMPLYELDRQGDIDYLTSIYIPRDVENNKDFYDLLDIMEKLRSSDGCPWDREQTHESIKKSMIEESYEVVEAIEKNDDNMVIEELGDVLFQIVFHAQLGKEEGMYNINDIISGICSKMIYRHPHVFGDSNCETSSDVIKKWDEIKKNEQGLKSHTDELKHVPKILPALMRADKVQKKAAKVGFDLDSIEGVFNKVLEEFYEVKNEYNASKKDRILEEVGDLIFSVVNVARFLDIDSEFALNYTIDKFIKRFEYIENEACNNNLRLEDMTLKQMDDLWNKSKSIEKDKI
ncbi:bifunctional methyltransferase/pyrophosphohydrolase YabN [Clostridium guangxiense]|uniref:nucleoside triphosphate pyrophosphohydrolase n=1 Tax=Clostridium guangxiense TaxID=1662055 RepID=UPI001E356086|nr:nucleoside triphosphate pyrophosphohydrolase [Clostridium guangxiense]